MSEEKSLEVESVWTWGIVVTVWALDQIPQVFDLSIQRALTLGFAPVGMNLALG